MRTGSISTVLGAAGMLLAGGAAYAQETAALPEGDVLPLAEVIEKIMPAVEGELGASRLTKSGAQWVYVIGFFDENGNAQEMRVDAATAQILSIKPVKR